ncbi:MAG: ATP-binding protein [Massilia sp.]
MKLRTHYLLLACAILLPAAVFCGIALKVLIGAQHDSAIRRIEDSVRLSAMVIDADIARAEAVLRALATSQALAKGDLESFYKESAGVNAGPGAWIILYDTNGQQVLNTRRPFGEGKLAKRPDPDQVAELLNTDKPNVSRMRWGAALNNNFVMVELAVTSASGQRYILSQAFSPEFFARAFASRAIPASWSIAVLDGDGVIIARRQQAEHLVGKPASAPTLQAVRSGHTGSLKMINRDGVEVYASFTHSTLSDWSIIFGVPASEVDAADWRGVLAIAAGLAIAIAAALGLTVFTGRKLIHFAGGAAEAARLLGRGRAVGALAPSGVAELDALNGAIRDASDRLQDEVRSRAAVERERNQLLVLEKDARARAEEQNAAKDEFLAMLGHELRNPLSAVSSAVSVLDSDRPLDEAVRTRARGVLRRQTDHLRKLVDDLLQVNRALMGKLTLDSAAVDLAVAVGRCIDTLHAAGRTKGFELVLEAAPSPVRADLTRLMQVIDNILDNAIKYSPNGGRIEVGVRHRGQFAELVVKDSGMGIPGELLPHVFTIFVQGEQTLQRAQGGLGIGLSLVRRLVELQGGTVAIDSAGPGLGTTVTVRLPLLDEPAPGAGDAAAPATGSARRILLVEDNPDARDMLTVLLEMLGCKVLAVDSGPRAIALAESAKPELAFIDIGLAGMDGYAIARALRAKPATAHIELIALTGYGSEDDRERAFEAGFHHHFTKPISIEQLQLALSTKPLSEHN